MTDDEKYFFDLNGYLVLRDVVDADTIRRCNEAIDHHDDQIEVHERRFEGESKALTSHIRQRWSDEMVAWKRPYCEPFRQLMVHPRLKPYLNELMGAYQMATQPRLIMMDKGLRWSLPARRPTRSAVLFADLSLEIRQDLQQSDPRGVSAGRRRPRRRRLGRDPQRP